MPTPKGGYWLDIYGKKTRIPSVTTVLKQIGWSSGGLMCWAHRQGLEGKTLDEARDAAADAGTIAHACIEADLHGREQPDLSGLPEEMRGQVQRAMEAWAQWQAVHKVERVHTELSLISKEYRYGGTLDVLSMDGELTLLDLKTTSGTYPDHLCQIAAYGKLCEENGYGAPVRYGILRLSRDDASFHYHSWPAESMVEALEAFICARLLYDIERVLKKRI